MAGDIFSTLEPAAPATPVFNAPAAPSPVPQVGTTTALNQGAKPIKKGQRGRRLNGAFPAMAPTKPAMGFEAYLGPRADELTGTRRVGPRGQSWHGGVSPEEAMAQAEAEFAAMSDEEKSTWTSKANMEHVRGSEDQKRMGDYRGQMNEALGGGSRRGRGRSLAEVSGAASMSDGGTGFSGVRGAGSLGQKFQLRSQDQVAARVAQSPVTASSKPIATIRQPAASPGMTSSQSADYKANVNPDGTLKSGAYASAKPPTLPAGAIATKSPAGRRLAETFG